MIQSFDPPLLVQLDNVTWMHCNPLPFLENNNIMAPLQKAIRWSGWLTTDDKSFMNASITVINIDNIILHTQVNTCGTISICFIECTFENEYIHVLHYLSKRYKYEYMISELIGAEARV